MSEVLKNKWKRIKDFIVRYPKYKKIIGIILLGVGILALVTPFTPGAWLIFVGLELLGIRFLLWDKIKKYFKK